jgi:predicted transcriptional regulator
VSYNFLPVVDDRDSFVGIVTRNKILKKLSDANHGEKRITTTISYGNPSLFTPNI